MRIAIPEEYQERPFEHLEKAYNLETLKAARNFGSKPYQHTLLSFRELEGARYRTALINGCVTCMNFRGARDFPGIFEIFDGDLENSVYTRGPKPDEEFYQNVENWKDYPGYTDRERLAIRYAEGLGQTPHDIAQDEDFWAQAKANFTDEEIVDMTYSIACWMGMGRAQHALGLDAVCSFEPARSQAKV